MFPDQLAEVVSQSMPRNLLESPDIRLLTSTPLGDIFAFGLRGWRAVTCEQFGPLEKRRKDYFDSQNRQTFAPEMSAGCLV